MSGGHWNRLGFKIQDALDTIATDNEVVERFPTLAKILDELGHVLYDIEHDLDWDLSGDSYIKDDQRWEDEAIWSLLKVLMTRTPDAWFPRGKWATIQAVDGRHDERTEDEG